MDAEGRCCTRIRERHCNQRTQLSSLLITTVRGRRKSASLPNFSSSCVISLNARWSPAAALFACCLHATSNLVSFLDLPPASLTVTSSRSAFRSVISVLTEPLLRPLGLPDCPF